MPWAPKRPMGDDVVAGAAGGFITGGLIIVDHFKSLNKINWDSKFTSRFIEASYDNLEFIFPSFIPLPSPSTRSPKTTDISAINPTAI
jgi:hypothetical protein